MDIETVKNIAHLARLEFTDAEQEALKEEAAKILDWMKKLDEIDTTDVEPLLHMHPNVNLQREDIAVNTLSKVDGLVNSPQPNPDYFVVPKVME